MCVARRWASSNPRVRTRPLSSESCGYAFNKKETPPLIIVTIESKTTTEEEEKLVPIMARALDEEYPTENTTTMVDDFVPIRAAAIAVNESREYDEENPAAANKNPTRTGIAHASLTRDEVDPKEEENKNPHDDPILVLQHVSRLVFLDHDGEEQATPPRTLNIGCLEELTIIQNVTLDDMFAPGTNTIGIERLRLLHIQRFIRNGDQFTCQTTMAQVIRSNIAAAAKLERAHQQYWTNLCCMILFLWVLMVLFTGAIVFK